jgi:hypothetical protein
LNIVSLRKARVSSTGMKVSRIRCASLVLILIGESLQIRVCMRDLRSCMDPGKGSGRGSTGSGSAVSDRVSVFAGYTDGVGHEDYNYELGQRRATSVA